MRGKQTKQTSRHSAKHSGHSTPHSQSDLGLLPLTALWLPPPGVLSTFADTAKFHAAFCASENPGRKKKKKKKGGKKKETNKNMTCKALQ